jgi:hypothetical protein
VSEKDKKLTPNKASGARALVLGASLSTIAVAGLTGAARAQTAAEEACAAIMHLRSPLTVERVLRDFADDPCIPVMLTSLPPSLLSRIDAKLVEGLSPRQLRNIPAAVLEILGLNPSQGTTRAIQNPYGY